MTNGSLHEAAQAGPVAESDLIHETGHTWVLPVAPGSGFALLRVNFSETSSTDPREPYSANVETMGMGRESFIALQGYLVRNGTLDWFATSHGVIDTDSSLAVGVLTNPAPSDVLFILAYHATQRGEIRLTPAHGEARPGLETRMDWSSVGDAEISYFRTRLGVVEASEGVDFTTSVPDSWSGETTITSQHMLVGVEWTVARVVPETGVAEATFRLSDDSGRTSSQQIGVGPADAGVMGRREAGFPAEFAITTRGALPTPRFWFDHVTLALDLASMGLTLPESFTPLGTSLPSISSGECFARSHATCAEPR